jgi:extradiol dioxygenase family protein
MHSTVQSKKDKTMSVPLHFAFHVLDPDAAREFYSGALGAIDGRSTETWVDFDFFGHQLSLCLRTPFANEETGKVGDHLVPMPRFGVVLPQDDLTALAGRLEERQTDFILATYVRFKGELAEQWTMFFRDPSGKPIEVKGFAAESGIFAS